MTMANRRETDFCKQGVEKHFVSGTLWKCSRIEGQFNVNRTLELI
jgi:hypothetical protein